jgi:2-dehydro-3-deoxygluconokinase
MSEYDVITVGEALLRLTPPGYHRLEQSPILERHIAGSELNTAVGLARLGVRTAWCSRLNDDPIGRLIARELTAQGVSAAHVLWTSGSRNAIYYLEEARPPRPSQVTYDRAHSAMSQIQPADLPDDLLVTTRSRLLHLSGITLAISESAHETARVLLDRARQSGIAVSFDVNYREKLWSEAQARSRCEAFMQQADILFIAQRDAERLFGAGEIDSLHRRYPQAVVVMTRGREGAAGIGPDGVPHHQPIFPAETVCRIGGGDAFSAGFLYAHFQDMPLTECLRYAAAAAALKYSLPGDLPLFDLSQIQHVLQHGSTESVQR